MKVAINFKLLKKIHFGIGYCYPHHFYRKKKKFFFWECHFKTEVGAHGEIQKLFVCVHLCLVEQLKKKYSLFIFRVYGHAYLRELKKDCVWMNEIFIECVKNCIKLVCKYAYLSLCIIFISVGEVYECMCICRSRKESERKENIQEVLCGLSDFFLRPEFPTNFFVSYTIATNQTRLCVVAVVLRIVVVVVVILIIIPILTITGVSS